MICKVCNNQIESERLEVLPATICCIACAHKHNIEKPRKGIMVFDGKTGGELQVMNADFFENNKQYFTSLGAQVSTHRDE